MIRSIVHKIGSLQTAVSLLVAAVILLSVSTYLESLHGTPFAQTVFYRAIWFDIFIGLFWINIFCATLSRIPFKKKHIGFVTTHIGILILLLGALISRVYGVEGQMTLFEGEQKGRILKEGYSVSLEMPGQKPRELAISLKPSDKPWTLFQVDEKGSELLAGKVYTNASVIRSLKEGSPDSPQNFAIQATLSSQAVGLKQDFSLIQKDPSNPHASFTQIGPAHIELKTKDPKSSGPSLRIRAGSDDRQFEVPLKPGTSTGIPVADSGLVITTMTYFTSAKVADNRIVDLPDEVRFNPAVEFEIRDPQGRSEHHTKFFLFPDFESLRGGKAKNIFDLTLSLDVPVPDHLVETPSPSLLFYPNPDGSWSYKIRSSKDGEKEGVVSSGQTVQTGWMDFSLEVQKLFTRAIVDQNIQELPKKYEGSPAVEVLLGQKGGDTKSLGWIMLDKSLDVRAGPAQATIRLKAQDEPVPFALLLRDFRKVDYPGTQNPSSFESDVLLHDHHENVTIEKTIKMNKPLDYKGFRIFQSSYIQHPDLGEASVFTVAKNPGIPYIYGGGCVILAGVILLFYLHPFFTGRKDEN
jgi:hypothetical protein